MKFLDLVGLSTIKTHIDNIYQRKEIGKGLSTNDFTNDDKNKLNNLSSKAQSDWLETDIESATYIKHKPVNISEFNNDSNFITQSDVDERFNHLIGLAPEALDTLEEIADKLTNNDEIHTAIINTISDKVSKEELNNQIKSLLIQINELSNKIAILESRDQVKILTQEEYNNIENKDDHTLYIVP